MNPFLDRESKGGELPRRTYARVDSMEPVDDGDETLVYAAGVQAEWFDQYIGLREGDELPPSAMEAMDRAPLSVTEFWLSDLATSDANEFPEGISVGDWLKIEWSAQGIESHQFASLFGLPATQRVSLSKLRSNLVRQLDAAFSLPKGDKTSEALIEGVLDKVVPVECVLVLDVGQGNAAGLWSRVCPTLYFDAGGGVVANVKTFPTARDSFFCNSTAAPVVLSHWDWDHWSSAMRFPEALELEWVVPWQQLDPIHLAFAYQLFKRNNLLVWPDSLREIIRPNVRVEKCFGGDWNDKNNTGLALTVPGVGHGSVNRILLPGDANFDSIPSVLRGEKFEALLASHHGSRVNGIGKLQAPNQSGALVYSVGHGNTFGHPRLHAELEYLQANWQPGRTFATTQKRRKRPCDIGLNLNGNGPAGPCTVNPRIWA